MNLEPQPPGDEPKIFQVRGHRVMLAHDLAAIYGIETRILSQAVKRNLERFPSDFMLMLTTAEWGILKSQFVISSWGGIRKPPLAFTEQGVAMLSSVLPSKTAVQVNIGIMRVFIRTRELAGTHAEILRRLDQLEMAVDQHDQTFLDVYQAIQDLIEADAKDKVKKIEGFQ